MKFRKKPIVIEAMQWDGDQYELFVWVQNTCPDSPTGLTYSYVDIDTGQPSLKIGTLEGSMTVSLNDWIICGVNGEFYPCKPDIFAKTYEPLDDFRPGRG